MKKINIGFDIGTTSVGYCLMEDGTNTIVKMGVRLFEDVASSKDGSLKSGKRRDARSARRRLNRLKIRKEDLIKWFVNNNFASDGEVKKILESYDITKYGVNNPIELKVKALNEKITKNELIIILFHYIQHRGFFYLTQDMLKEQEDLQEEKDLKKDFPSIILNNFQKANRFYKGSKEASEISVHEYEREIKAIFKKQGIEDSLLESYLENFMSKRIREFSKGPGSEKSPTPYGLFRKNLDNNDVEKIGENLWDALIGKCTYYTDESRGGSSSPKAEIFNLLNELNNLYFHNEKSSKLSKESKKFIFEEINNAINANKSTKKDINLKLIVKAVQDDNIEINNISGFPINKEKKENFTKLKNYSLIIKWLKNVKILKKVDLFFDIKILEKANDVFIKLQEDQDINKQLNILKKYLNEHNIKEDCSVENKKLLKDISGLSQTHSLSYKAMLEYIKHGIEHSENQMIFFSNQFPNKINEKFKDKKYLPTGLFDEEIISPTARRAFNQNVAVMNKIIKLYSKQYDINNITFELPRDKNSAEETQSINKSQKEKEKFGKEIAQEFGCKWEELNSKTKMKIKLWKQQDYKDIYDFSFIDFKDVIRDGEYEVDHIIPFSICGIDALYNKVLTKSHINKAKSNKTPYQYFSTNGGFEKFKLNVQDLYNKKLINKNKMDFLLFEKNPLTEMEQFIDRNLVDTRYASKLVLNIFDSFFKANKNLYPNAKVKVINGAMTNYSRYNQFFIAKDRDDYVHHAVDAAIISFLGSHNRIQKLVKYKDGNLSNYKNAATKNEEFLIYDKETGEIVDLSKDKLEKNQETQHIKTQIDNLINNNKVSFSRMIITKSNMQLFNETIYSIKWDNDEKKSGTLINKLNLIKGEKLDDYFDNEKRKQKKYESLHCYQNDRQFYDKLTVIYNQFKKNDSKQNPFLSFMNEKMNVPQASFLQIENQKIKYLKYDGDQKNISNIVKLKSHNDNAIHEKLNIQEVRIYKNKKNDLITIPLNIKVIKSENNKLVIDQKKLNEVLISHNIENHEQFIEIKNGTILINKNNEKPFYANGGGQMNQNKLEIKPLFTKTEKYFPRSQMQIAISSITKEYDLCQVDVLGNIYDRKTFQEFFEN